MFIMKAFVLLIFVPSLFCLVFGVMESDLSLALPKLCLEHITAEIQHMANVRNRERESERKQKEQKKNRAGLTFGFSVSKTPPPSVARPCSDFFSFVLCPQFLTLTLFLFSSHPFLKVLLIYMMCFFRLTTPLRKKISFYSVASLVKSLCEVSTALLIWQAAHKLEHIHTRSKRWLKTGRGGASDEEQNDDVSLAHVIRGDRLVYEKPLLNNHYKVTKDRAAYYWWMDRRLKMMNSQ